MTIRQQQDFFRQRRETNEIKTNGHVCIETMPVALISAGLAWLEPDLTRPDLAGADENLRACGQAGVKGMRPPKTLSAFFSMCVRMWVVELEGGSKGRDESRFRRLISWVAMENRR